MTVLSPPPPGPSRQAAVPAKGQAHAPLHAGRADPTRLMMMLFFIGGMTLCSIWVMRPFLPATIWAATIVVAVWPLVLKLQKLLGGSRVLAVTIMTIIVVVLFVVPFWLAVTTILNHIDALVGLAHAAVAFRLPAPPHWAGDIPVIGDKVREVWEKFQGEGLSTVLPSTTPYIGSAAQWILGSIGSFGRLLLQFILTTVIVAIMSTHGEAGANLATQFGYRLGGDRGEQMVVLAGRAIRAVALGVMLTSLADAVIGGIGLMIAGVPLATLLTAVMFIFCVAQVGPGIVLIPADIWMFVSGQYVMGAVLLVVTIVAIAVDNLMRPLLIRKEANLPMLLVLVGVLGGLAAFGLIGLFIGPAVLAVSYTMLRAWIAEEARPGAPALPPDPLAVAPDPAIDP
ncbi:AI-2E family transporter YdiK [Acidisoma cellulosilytica]|uniref:AI-2E family transporter YdiK n=1 Tax=Acidisoma cellulosilyticum TaxID=2802395 RepID=A0A964E670_9PROT|nr:AI-2E family transporter YdiK [Acidisoma cellulosilyticum]MCB8883246.1 AI-2E family transporter YdiK [Acidisoma cellulosilyticum]